VLAGLSPARRRLVVTVLALVVVAVLATGAALLLGRP
jgi:triacylglycerol lipase